jgi:hypothetical protein
MPPQLDIEGVLRPGRSLTWRASPTAAPAHAPPAHTRWASNTGRSPPSPPGDPLLSEPVGEGLQTRAERRRGTHLLAAPAGAIRHTNTGHDLILADIQSSAAFVDHLHRRHLLVGLVRHPAGPTDQATLKDVLTATVRGAGTAPASVLSTGSLAPRRAELGRATRFSSLVAATSHVGLISSLQVSAMQTAVFPGHPRTSRPELSSVTRLDRSHSRWY